MGVWAWLGGLILLLIVWEIAPDATYRLILIGLASLGGWLVYRNGRRLWGAGRQPALSLSSDELLVGQPFTLRYRAGPADSQGARRVTARLICRESASFQPAGQRQPATDVEDLVVQEVEAEVPQTRGAAALELAVPLDAMHSFRSHHHQIGWRVEVEVRAARSGKVERVDLPLTVLPGVQVP
jgi:hypothetical protein